MRLSYLAVAVLGAISSQGLAQESEQSAFEVIEVTAQKRVERIQDVGISITAINGDELEDLGAFQASAITEFIPNMEMAWSEDSGIPIFVIRGVGLQDYNTNNTPNTAVVVDDVYQPYGIYTAFSMFDTERVEVLKGPQGGLYGRNSTGGAVSFTSKKPEMGTTEANAAVDFGNYNTINVRAGASLPLGDIAAIRVALQTDNSDGYYYNTFLNRNQGGKDKQQARVTLSLEPTENFRADVRYTYGRDKTEASIPEVVGLLDPNASWEGPLFGLPGLPPMNIPYNPDGTIAWCDPVVNTGIPDSTCINMNRAAPDGDPYRGADARVHPNDDRFDSLSLNIAWDFGNHSLASITNQSKMQFKHRNGIGSVGLGPGQDQDGWEQASRDYGRINGGDLNEMYVTQYNSDTKSWSQELRLLSNYSGDFNWMLGAVYAQDDIDELRSCSFAANLYADWIQFPGCGTMAYRQETKVASAYAQIDYSITETLSTTIDFRYTHEKKDYMGDVFVNDGTWICTVNGLNTTDPNNPAYCANFIAWDPDTGLYDLARNNQAKYDEKDPSWKVNLDWKVTPETLLYASVGSTFKSGGFFGGFLTNPNAIRPYKPERNNGVELGFKSTIENARLQINGALFSYDYKNFQSQLQEVDPASGATFNGLRNLGDVKMAGAELDLRWLPTDAWDLRAAVGLLDTKVDKVAEFESDNIGITSIFGEVQNVEGNELNNAPKFSANLIARYNFNLSSNLGGFVQVDASYKDDYWLSISNEPIHKQKGYGLVNARAEIFSPSDNWSVAIWGRNLSGEAYRTTFYLDGLDSGYSEYNAPRTYGVTLAYTY
ncbi:TonB-dependent receptor [Paraferrimonas sedimenticola]|uniref:TonB-dependent receptor n=1 Tax=Paraferrimonas sedimenticola TaxID=375674 RepID=A0AA37W0W3_9GAMM|nr:TonB-dependent receptor [Paraferrimonas sedimenticola]GLP96640.1 TonB-dependent receptor [Paraferrimonas sedimenticola]